MLKHTHSSDAESCMSIGPAGEVSNQTAHDAIRVARRRQSAVLQLCIEGVAFGRPLARAACAAEQVEERAQALLICSAKAGIREQVSAALIRSPETNACCSTHTTLVRAHQQAATGKEQVVKDQAPGRPREGLPTKIHVLAAALRRLLRQSPGVAGINAG